MNQHLQHSPSPFAINQTYLTNELLLTWYHYPLLREMGRVKFHQGEFQVSFRGMLIGEVYPNCVAHLYFLQRFTRPWLEFS